MTQSPSLPETDWHPKSFERAFSCEHMEKFWQEGYEAGSAAAAQAVPDGFWIAPDDLDQSMMVAATRQYMDNTTCTARDLFQAVRADWISRNGRSTAPTQGAEGAAPQAVVGEVREDAENILNSWLDNQHPDDVAVDAFASKMRQKMAASRARGRGGWNDKAQCSAETLSSMLRDHVEKGDPVDVANFAMMLAQRGERVSSSPTPTAPREADALREASERVALLETALSEVLEFQSAHEGPHIFDWGRWRRIRDNTPPFQRAALAQHQPQQGEQHE